MRRITMSVTVMRLTALSDGLVDNIDRESGWWTSQIAIATRA